MFLNVNSDQKKQQSFDKQKRIRNDNLLFYIFTHFGIFFSLSIGENVFLQKTNNRKRELLCNKKRKNI